MRPLLACRVSRVIQLGLLILPVSCGGDSNNNPNPTTNQGKTIYAVDLSNNFELFHSGTPGTVDRKVAITGLPAENRIVGIDFRPAGTSAPERRRAWEKSTWWRRSRASR